MLIKLSKSKFRMALGLDYDILRLTRIIQNLLDNVDYIQVDVNNLKTMRVYIGDVEVGQVQVTS